MKKILLVSIVVLLFTACSKKNDGNEFNSLTFTMGSQTGSMYATGIALSDFMAKNFPKVVTSVKVGGALGNIELVNNGEAQVGHSSSGMSFAATKGTEPFSDKKENIRTIVKLLESSFTFAITKDSGISSLEEIASKKYPLKISVGPRNRENELLSRLVLKEYGITYEDIQAWGGRVEYVSISDASSLLRDGHIEAVTILSGIPYAPIEEMNIARGFNFLELNSEVRQTLEEEYGYVDLEIAAGAYTGLQNNVPTVGGGVVLIVNKDVPENIVYEVTKWINSAAGIQQLGSLSGSIKKFLDGSKKTITGLGAPLHSGAMKFYKESGLL